MTWWNIIKDEEDLDDALEQVSFASDNYGITFNSKWIRGPLSPLNQFASLFNKDGEGRSLFKPNSYLSYSDYDFQRIEPFTGRPNVKDLANLVRYSIKNKDSNWQVRLYINYDFEQGRGGWFPDLNIKIYENDKHVASIENIALRTKVYSDRWFREWQNLNFKYKNITLFHSYKNKPITLKTGNNPLNNIINIIKNEFMRLKKYSSGINYYSLYQSIVKRMNKGKISEPENWPLRTDNFRHFCEKIVLPIMKMTNMPEYEEMSKLGPYRRDFR
mgnify:FL=1